ncbi:xylulokinase [Deinococcus yavapaiensis]|uniref:Xylulose kinase n=1 Tax=Deinococcus yavapaiensis KR-236 TaxID=694435 RepID=A0A318SDW6_9DEIO|nr:xylulokinase [Deinococcus yavapaiensis]PYE54629.1 xylulokinase [Deinococcus yavapaiensis KR-236]
MFLGVDLGTSSVKAVLYDEAGRLVRDASAAYAVASPRPGWAETDPEAWWSATVSAVRTAAEDGLRVKALGLSGQMHGVVLTNLDGSPARPAVLWADGRATRQLAAYEAVPPTLLARLRNPVTTGMAGPTLLWLRDHEPGVYEGASLALQPKDWLRLRLTGKAHAEPSDASGTLLYDLERDAWHDDLVAVLGLRRDLLPPLVASGERVGELSTSAARALGLSEGVQVVAGAADTAAALLGTGLTASQVQLTVGTGAQLVVRSATLPTARRGVHVFRGADAGFYVLGAVQNAGLALEWARRALRAEWREFYALARSADFGSGGVIFLPYLTGDRTPHLDPHARGGWIGAGLQHDASHLARAAFEGVAFSIRQALGALAPAETHLVRLAGGGSVHPWWRQLLADVLERPLEVVDIPDASALGASLLARGAEAPLAKVEGIVEPRGELRLADAVERFEAAYEHLEGWFGPRLGA